MSDPVPDERLAQHNPGAEQAPAFAATLDPNRLPRCRKCGYVLVGLMDARCPECGQPFRIDDPRTYTTKPPFIWWKYWLPGWLLSLGMGLLLYLLVTSLTGWGWAATLVLPFCAGALLGYAVRVRWFSVTLLVFSLTAGLFLGLVSLSLAGVFCGLILAGIIIGPIFLGAMCGASLRLLLKRSQFSQRWHLPILFLALPLVAALIERAISTSPPVEAVRTSIVIPVPVARAWRAIGFYEQVQGEAPRLFRFPGMPRPLAVAGSTAHVGDRTVCIYNKGRLVKSVTARQENQLLAFHVIEQGFEQHDVTLVGGSFAFQPVDPDHTRVTLETTYKPLLRPRWCWRPFEELTVHTLHEHVLSAMARKATSPDQGEPR